MAKGLQPEEMPIGRGNPCESKGLTALTYKAVTAQEGGRFGHLALEGRITMAGTGASVISTEELVYTQILLSIAQQPPYA